MRKKYLIFIAVFVILAVGYTFRFEILSKIYVEFEVKSEIRKKLHDPSSLQIVEFVWLYGARANELDNVPRGLKYIMEPLFKSDVVEGLRVFKVRYRAKNAYGALRLNTAYGFGVSYKGGPSHTKVYDEDELRL